MNLPALCLLGSLLIGSVPTEDRTAWPGAESRWEGFRCHDFEVDGAHVIVVEPQQPLPGKPWAWRGEFFGAYPNADLALLRQGWHLAYIEVPDLFGAPAAMRRWERLHATLVQEHGLDPRPALIGLSRGALYCMAWAAEHPGQTLLVYLDNGVCDFKSWPGGQPKGLGTGQGSPEEWGKLLKAYGFVNDQEATGSRLNPVDRLEPLAKANLPILLVYGDSDRVVPHRENSEVVYDRYRALGGPVERIVKPGQDHHPHGLDDPAPVVAFFERVRQQADAGWESLFDGKSLDGWQVNGGKATYRVEDGAIVGTTTEGSPNTFLCQGNYSDFVLELEVQCDPRLNSGVQVRSHVYRADDPEPAHRQRAGVVYGPQCEVARRETGTAGRFYDEGRRGQWLAELKPEASGAFRDDGWNQYRIVVQGNRYRSWVNGVAASDFTDDLDKAGFIGLQVHGIAAGEGPYQVRWRNIRIRPLQPGEAVPPPRAR